MKTKGSTNKKIIISIIVLLALVVCGCIVFYKNKSNGSLKIKNVFTESALNDYQTLTLEYSDETLQTLDYVKTSVKDASAKPKEIQLNQLGETEVTYSIGNETIVCTFIVNDTQAPVITFNADSVDVSNVDEFDSLSNIVSVEDPVDGGLPKMDSEPEKFAGSADGRVYETGWYTVNVDGTTVTVHAVDNHGNASDKSYQINVSSDEEITDDESLYSYTPVDLDCFDDPQSWQKTDKNDWYYSECSYLSGHYQTPDEALQDVISHETERGNTEDIESAVRIFCIKNSAGNILYYQAGFEE